MTLDDGTLAEIHLWLRLAPAICLVWVAVGTYFESALMIWALVPFAALGTVLRGHPFDLVYNHGIRYLFGTPRLPPYNRPRRFGCAVAAAWLALESVAFHTGATTLGLLLGWSFTLAPLVNVVSGFCVPSYVFGRLFGPPTATRELIAYAEAHANGDAAVPFWRRPVRERTQPRVFTAQKCAWIDPGVGEVSESPLDRGSPRPS